MKKICRRLLPERIRDQKTTLLHKPVDTETQESDGSKAAAKLGLEELAVELKLAVLRSLSNLSDLQSLVHASPLYHGVYLTDRHGILQCVLLNGLDPRSLQYVLAIGRALDIGQRRPETREEVLSFLEVFKTIDMEPTSDLRAIFLRHGPSLAQIQLSIQFAIHDFCTSVLSKHPITGKAFKEDAILSLTEQARISRAFYRYQIFCIVFQETSDHQYLYFDITDRSFLFLNLFSPWEVEEIACVRDYVTRKYTHLFERYATELSEQRSDKNSSSSDETVVEPNDVCLTDYVERCISRGIPYLQTILQAPSPRQIEMLRDNLLEIYTFLTEALDDTPYDFSYRTQHYHDWINQAELRFTSDTVETPNAAWSWSTGNKVEIMYNLSPDLSEWGYVFWDKERLDRWGILDQDNTPYLRTTYD